MSEKQKILIGSTNKGKIIEIKGALGTLPFEFVTPDELENVPDIEESAETLEENALQKARHYAQATGLLTLADDSGLYLDGKKNWPGVYTRRIAATDDDRRKKVIEATHEAGNTKAAFISAMALYNPTTDEVHIAVGKAPGEILTEEVGEHLPNLPYDSIFYIPEMKKTYAELTTVEKNAISHRGKSLIKMKYMLHNLFRPKHVIVPVALIIKEGKLLMNLRNDPHNPDVHEVWEFPGGSVEYKETLEENLVREVQEETGYDVDIVSMLPKVTVDAGEKKGGVQYQVYLIPYVCTITGGSGSFSDKEVLESKWFDLDEVLSQKLIRKNGDMYKELLPELKKVISEHNL